MSKRLNKRQQREQEELEQLRAVEKLAEQPAKDEPEEEDDDDDGETVAPSAVLEAEEVEEGLAPAAPVNAFAALGAEADDDEDVEEEEEVPTATASKKSKKKKPKKKKKAASAVDELDADEAGPSTPTPSGKNRSKKGGKAAEVDDGMDEVDRALAELDMKAGARGEASSGPTTVAAAAAASAASSSTLGLRQLLAVDPKNLDADAELRRFFGSKVISSTAASSKSHRATASTKLRYTISKPKPTYPPATSLAGLGMRELSDEEVEDVYLSRMAEWHDPAEKWFTFEHAGVWREITRQFLGATRSHDPNQLMALLQVYPWHVDTLLQMSEVYRLQSDIGAASDYAERALYALDRCLIPAFNVSSGACRLNFDNVENRPMFMAIHRIIAYLGRRGCWVTAFNFAKLLFSLDPMVGHVIIPPRVAPLTLQHDPHGAAFWLDFLAIKSGNYAWILSMFEDQSEQLPAAVFQGYPGMAFAYALACRAREDAQKSADHVASDQALREAVLAFPQAIIPLADKIGATLPSSARAEPLLQVQAAYTDDPECPLHLLSHIYVSRSEALWKEAPMTAWFTKIVAASLPDLHRADAVESRKDALRLVKTFRDPYDEISNIPLFICRHVVCSESTSFAGFLPPLIAKLSINAYDPLPPHTAKSAYDNAYFSGVARRTAGRSVRSRDLPGDGVATTAADLGLMEQVRALMQGDPGGWRQEMVNVLRNLMAGGPGEDLFAGIPGGLEAAADEIIAMAAEAQAGNLPEDGVEGEAGEDLDVPGAFPH